MFVAVINHALARQALDLKRSFAAHAQTIVIDSGSSLTAAERAEFDVALPNVYYSGLLNEIAQQTRSLKEADPVYIWCSDVTVPDQREAISLAAEAFRDPTIGTYAPSAWHSFHGQMRNRGTGTLRTVSFVDGFCFATRVSVLRELCPIDTRVNIRGWGLEVQIGYLTRRAGLRTVIDDRIEARHPSTTGYSRNTANAERIDWRKRLPAPAWLFFQLATRRIVKQSLGMRLLLALPWR
jgi:hypothetical protein